MYLFSFTSNAYVFLTRLNMIGFLFIDLNVCMGEFMFFGRMFCVVLKILFDCVVFSVGVWMFCV